MLSTTTVIPEARRLIVGAYIIEYDRSWSRVVARSSKAILGAVVRSPDGHPHPWAVSTGSRTYPASRPECASWLLELCAVDAGYPLDEMLTEVRAHDVVRLLAVSGLAHRRAEDAEEE